MINEDKVKTMINLAIYEKREGKKYLPVSRYYRTDYVGQAMIKNLFLVTIGYGLILLILGVYFSDYFMENIHKMNLRLLGTYLIGGYAILLVAYSVITFMIYTIKYYAAKKSVKKYYSGLTSLDKLLSREDRLREERESVGGNKR